MARSTARIRIVSLALLACSVQAAPAAAQQVEPAADGSGQGEEVDLEALEARKKDAAARYEKGVAAYREGRFADAIRLFLEADALAPSPALSFNIARAYEKIDDAANVLRWYRDYLRRAPEAEDRETVLELVEKYEAILQEKGVQQLSVLSEPPGATVRVDRQPVGVTPWTGELAPGAHTISLSLRGYADTKRQIDLSPDASRDVSVRLVPAARASSAEPEPERQGRTPAAPRRRDGLEDSAPGRVDRSPHIWTYVALGAGAAALGTAAGFEWARRSAEDDARAESTQIGYARALERMEQRQTTARVLAGAGAALAVAGGVLLWVDLSRGPMAAQASCQPGGCLVWGSWRF